MDDETYDGVEVMHLIPILNRISENLPATRILGRVCGACGCLMAEREHGCINCKNNLLNGSM